MSNPYVRNYILSQAQAKVLSQTQGLYPAPLRILDVCIESFHYKKTYFLLLGDQTNTRSWFKCWI